MKDQLYDELNQLARNLACNMIAHSRAGIHADQAPTTTSAQNWLELQRYLADEMQMQGLRIWDIAADFFNNQEGNLQ
jgi:hypothetical protein